MKFRKLNKKDLIVRIEGEHCSSYDYGVIANMNKTLSYYPLDFERTYKSHFYSKSNDWLGRAARATLSLPRKYIFGVNRDLLNQHSDQIEDRMEEISNSDLEKQMDLYIKHAVLPHVQVGWKNRVWPIDKEYLRTSQEEVCKMFLERGDFS